MKSSIVLCNKPEFDRKDRESVRKHIRGQNLIRKTCESVHKHVREQTTNT